MSYLDIPAYCKINLGLRILRKRRDGYHELETIFQQVSLADTVRIRSLGQSRGGQVKLFQQGLPTPSDATNLCHRAASVFYEATRIQHAVEIELTKRVPTGAGLGGGSSNAAAVLMGLNRIHDEPLNLLELGALAARLGADVPFFLHGGAALARGIGEQLADVPLPMGYWIVIVHPSCEISTSWAYGRSRIALTKKKKGITFTPPVYASASFFANSHMLVNDFESIVFGEYPALREIKQRIVEKGATYASLSGSGSSIFGIYLEEERAREAWDHFGRKNSSFVVRPICFGYCDWLRSL